MYVSFVKGLKFKDMRILGKYFIRNARGIRRQLIQKLKENDIPDNNLLTTRILQIYSCRIFGLCFYRGENTHEKEVREILNEASKK